MTEVCPHCRSPDWTDLQDDRNYARPGSRAWRWARAGWRYACNACNTRFVTPDREPEEEE